MLNCQFAGRYRLEARDPRSGRVRRSAWSANLIVDQGLDLMATTTDYLRYCRVGLGGAETSPGTTQMANPVATAETSGERRRVDTEARYVAVVMEYYFAPGQVSGEIREVGAGRWADTDLVLFSRSRIVDANGNGTALNVVDGDALYVYYELRAYYPSDDLVTTVDGIAVITRPALVTDASELGWYLGYADGWARSRMAYQANTTRPRLRFYDTDIGAVTDKPSQPDYAEFGLEVMTDQAYVAGSFERHSTLRIEPSQGNSGIFTGSGMGPYRSLLLAYGPGAYQLQFDPPLDKTAARSLTLDLTFSWQRRTL